MNQISISFYISLEQLSGFNLKDYLDKKIPLSGTDGQLLNRALRLGEFFNVIIYTNIELDPTIHLTGIEFVFLRSIDLVIKDAVKRSAAIILVNRNNQETLDAIKIAEEVKLKSIIWHHNGPYPAWYKILEKALYVKRIICVSQGQVDYYRNHNIFYKSTYIYNSVNMDELQIMSEDKNPYQVCYIGALTIDKGFHYLAKVWSSIREIFPNAKLIVMGSAKLHNNHTVLGELGIASDEYEAIIKSYLGYTKKEIEANGVSFLGLVSPKEMKKYISASSIGVVNPGLISVETFCLGAVEMQALGLPVIGANRLGLKETILNKQTGLLHNSETELKSNLIALLKNEDLRKDYSSRCREFVARNFSEDIINKKWVNLIIGVVKDEKNKVLKLSLKNLRFKTVIRELIRIFKYPLRKLTL